MADIWDQAPRPRRGSSRWHLGIPCRLLHDGEETPARLADVSLNGAFLESDRDLEVGTPVKLILASSSDSPGLRLDGTVRHVRCDLPDRGLKAGFGIRFRTLSPGVRLQLRALLNRSSGLVES